MLKAIQAKWYMYSVVEGRGSWIREERENWQKSERMDGGNSRDRGRKGVREKSVFCGAWRLQPRYR